MLCFISEANSFIRCFIAELQGLQKLQLQVFHFLESIYQNTLSPPETLWTHLLVTYPPAADGCRCLRRQGWPLSSVAAASRNMTSSESLENGKARTAPCGERKKPMGFCAKTNHMNTVCMGILPLWTSRATKRCRCALPDSLTISLYEIFLQLLSSWLSSPWSVCTDTLEAQQKTVNIY